MGDRAHCSSVALFLFLVLVSLTNHIYKGLFTWSKKCWLHAWKCFTKRLCCECGVLIAPNPSAMCANCIRSRVDITEGIPKQVSDICVLRFDNPKNSSLIFRLILFFVLLFISCEGSDLLLPRLRSLSTTAKPVGCCWFGISGAPVSLLEAAERALQGINTESAVHPRTLFKTGNVLTCSVHLDLRSDEVEMLHYTWRYSSPRCSVLVFSERFTLLPVLPVYILTHQRTVPLSFFSFFPPHKVRMVDAGFIWTEPHSRRVKVKITIQKEVRPGDCKPYQLRCCIPKLVIPVASTVVCFFCFFFVFFE